jgi:hypothetical protein
VLSQDVYKRWAELPPSYKVATLQNMANDLARRWGIESVPVVAEDMKGMTGFYWNGAVHIDSKGSADPDTAFRTVAHEMRHAFQLHVATPVMHTQGGDRYQHIHHGTHDTKAMTWHVNYFQSYVSPDTDYAAYRNQPLEKNAFAHEEEFVRTITPAKLETYIPPGPIPQPPPTPTPTPTPTPEPMPRPTPTPTTHR